MSYLTDKFNIFKVNNLIPAISPDEFKAAVLGRIGVIDSKSEGYRDDELERQRDLSIKFHWGHEHDFGTFKVEGLMKNRHILLLEKFLEIFPVSVESFTGKKVLDIGCWTGGTSLLLSTISGHVTAVEEVKKYADTASYLMESFGVNGEVISQSLYSLNSDEFYQVYDRVYFPGVIYHLSDPVLALRILFNSLAVGGDILVETAGFDSEEPICKFEGNYLYHPNGTREELNRGGWNYFKFSGASLERMMKEAGFENIETHWDKQMNRLFAYGVKNSQVPICKAGLSVPDIR